MIMELDSSPTSLQINVSDDDEIDYSVKPEFYDSDLDSKDEKWVQKRRKGARVGTSDAVLSCPACFTTLCLESQRHDQFVTQYRAIFVVNCAVKPKPANPILLRQKGNALPPKRKHGMDSVVDDEVVVVAGGSSRGKQEAILKSVCCQVCSTEVGIVDEDEIYHFFDVLPSEA